MLIIHVTVDSCLKTVKSSFEVTIENFYLRSTISKEIKWVDFREKGQNLPFYFILLVFAPIVKNKLFLPLPLINLTNIPFLGWKTPN